ncbi:MAG: hypothetical protein V9F06_07365 [Thermomicrobiales bacterium]|jgi:hypothetical protein
MNEKTIGDRTIGEAIAGWHVCAGCGQPIVPGLMQRDGAGRPYHMRCWLYRPAEDEPEDDECPF